MELMEFEKIFNRDKLNKYQSTKVEYSWFALLKRRRSLASRQAHGKAGCKDKSFHFLYICRLLSVSGFCHSERRTRRKIPLFNL